MVPSLEGFWWQENFSAVDCSDKSAFHWISVIRVPDFISIKDFDWAVKMATNKKKIGLFISRVHNHRGRVMCPNFACGSIR